VDFQKLQEIKPDKKPVIDLKMPFSSKSPLMEIIGSVLILILLTLSIMGGLAGAGNNIPTILIFFDMHMKEVVPITAFIGVTSTVFRFILNFNQKHPDAPKRTVINYEAIELTIPMVFLGSFYGVIIG